MKVRQDVGQLIRECENIVALSAMHRKLVEEKRKEKQMIKERNDKR